MPQQHYPVVTVLGPPERSENRGARTKFWIRIQDEPTLWLLKFPRPITGEHWAEKIVTEIGHLIGVNCAKVELARCEGQSVTFDQSAALEEGHWQTYLGWLGTICESFIPIEQSASSPTEEEHYFFHGSELLDMIIKDYDTNVRFGQRKHSVKNILFAMARLMDIESLNPMPFWDEELKELASYALLDGLVGNTDRHYENWMMDYILDEGDLRSQVLPSFDHASSLGREITDERRTSILKSDGILGYLHRGREGVFVDRRRKLALSPLRLAQLLCRWAPDFTRGACERIGAVSDSEIWNLIDKVPPELMSDIAKDFAYNVVVTSRTELLRDIR